MQDYYGSERHRLDVIASHIESQRHFANLYGSALAIASNPIGNDAGEPESDAARFAKHCSRQELQDRLCKARKRIREARSRIAAIRGSRGASKPCRRPSNASRAPRAPQRSRFASEATSDGSTESSSSEGAEPPPQRARRSSAETRALLLAFVSEHCGPILSEAHGGRIVIVEIDSDDENATVTISLPRLTPRLLRALVATQPAEERAQARAIGNPPPGFIPVAAIGPDRVPTLAIMAPPTWNTDRGAA